ncbi:hypothetical protein [Zeaxanthinibacter enoshimensis]|uniref:Uncharacterized protein n=1 Tax=Zeaxanthinibacter enoshimensis TaxID=392009 RepID=A0A4R6TVD7_9FLAO|nr:hypothetical protein [Zeaxanthinibacter enoshimensis]TDQ32898.1 hypothetical protein CLV82_0735 [Zeaxanthinibacter enoshimensis]
MKRKLKDELNQLASAILSAKGEMELSQLYEASRKLYEKIAVLRFIEDKLNDIEIDVSSNAIANKFEKMATAVMNENKSVPESNPHQEDIIIPGMQTIKDMISEMPGEADVDQFFAEFVAKPKTIKNDKEDVTPEIPNGKNKSLNETLTQKVISVGLNDRHAFVKHLFNGSTEDFNRVISQLNTIDNEERSIAFIENMVKPDYNNWAGQEEIASRFMSLISRRFS